MLERVSNKNKCGKEGERGKTREKEFVSCCLYQAKLCLCISLICQSAQLFVRAKQVLHSGMTYKKIKDIEN